MLVDIIGADLGARVLRSSDLGGLSIVRRSSVLDLGGDTGTKDGTLVRSLNQGMSMRLEMLRSIPEATEES